MENKYYENSCYVKEKILTFLNNILQEYNYCLELSINKLNLLQEDDNCIESSTAIGYCVEEFIVAKLLSLTKNKEIIIQRNNKSTQNSSYDCTTKYNNEIYLINLKIEKENNNAISAIKQLYNDYVLTNPEDFKHFLIIKFLYKIEKTKIKINGIDAFFLEELDFSSGYSADNRNWSNKVFKHTSGRLQISKSFRKENTKNINDISYYATYDDIKKIFEGKIKRN